MQVGLQYGLPLLSPVDDAGVFTSEAGPFKGLQVNSLHSLLCEVQHVKHCLDKTNYAVQLTT